MINLESSSVIYRWIREFADVIYQSELDRRKVVIRFYHTIRSLIPNKSN